MNQNPRRYGSLKCLMFVLMVAVGNASAQEISIDLVEVVSGLTKPTGIAHAGDGFGRLFVIEKTGDIRIVSAAGTLLSQPFLDLSGLITTNSERGLLGLAFHPNYETNGLFYIHYSDLNGDTVLARYSVSTGNPDVADPGSADILLTANQPFANHNGGQLAFGPDGYLYMALGDGGSGGDPGDRAQDLTLLLGKILRLDINDDDFASDPLRDYAIPPDNPFVGKPGLDEIWAYGLRNPWRFSFDRLTGDLWIGDVGQGSWEEINLELAASPGGRNYGWDVLEGAHCFEDDPGGDGACADFLAGASILPVLEYDHGFGCSVTGGYRYRGSDQPALYGTYLYADYCTGRIWGTLPRCDGVWESQVLLDSPFNISSFGEDEDGELYVAEFSNNASLYRVEVVGTTGGPYLSPVPAGLGFGSQTVGANITLPLEIRHFGDTGNAVVDQFLLTDSDNFSIDLNAGANACGAPPVSVAPGTSCTLSVTFNPQREGGFDECLYFMDNTPLSPAQLIALVPCTGPNQGTVQGTYNSTSYEWACQHLTAGPNLTVTAAGDLELRAGESVALNGPFMVVQGGELSVVIDQALTQ